MFDLPPDVNRLRVIEQQLTIWLGHVRAAIAEAEATEALKANTRRLTKPHIPYRLRDPIRTYAGPPARHHLHTGRCDIGGGRPITREQALEALTAGAEACTFCRPDTELGIL
ncbi:DUF6233 domain-containing protein [Streptomyces sp. 4R-3d]|uniref:DUF6233 domain-containing protein n=1 Tax=Streptomyces sp. 4R-3d TaxID=2559605 RepID=UPI001071F180|nr:DUF6233 domain-containing protein [Streptomyces sp. 4R-3d]TFI30188.1 hypothetical protein E4P36_05430 [Streptomyces sp. 4R-3d]